MGEGRRARGWGLGRLPEMSSTVDFDSELVERVRVLSGAPTRQAAVTAAWREFVARRDQARLRELFGRLEWDPDYDYKRERSRG